MTGGLSAVVDELTLVFGVLSEFSIALLTFAEGFVAGFGVEGRTAAGEDRAGGGDTVRARLFGGNVVIDDFERSCSSCCRITSALVGGLSSGFAYVILRRFRAGSELVSRDV